MSQHARNNPEQYESGTHYEDVHDPDRVRGERKDAGEEARGIRYRVRCEGEYYMVPAAVGREIEQLRKALHHTATRKGND